jgi:hypothetical protein
MVKKIIIFAIMGIIFSSCSSDSDSGNLPITLQNIAGNWKIKSVVKSDGSIEPYINLCVQNPDYIKFYTYLKLEFYKYNNVCELFGIFEVCDNLSFTEDGYLVNCTSLTNGKITKLTRTEMQIDYEETRTLPYQSNNMDQINGIILEKQAE